MLILTYFKNYYGKVQDKLNFYGCHSRRASSDWGRQSEGVGVILSKHS